MLTPCLRGSAGGRGELADRRAPGVAAGWPECFLDAKQLVVFGGPIAAARRPGLDLAGGDPDGEVRDRGVLGFAGTMRNDRGVAGIARDRDGVERFGHRTDLIQL